MAMSARRLEDQAARTVITGLAAIAIVALALIFVFLLRDTLPVFKQVSLQAFLFGREWEPLPPQEMFGTLPLILGTIWVTMGAILIALPIGVCCAVYLAELAPRRVREPLKSIIEVLAGIPSVVLGFLGLVLLAPWVKGVFQLNTGLTALTGSIMLALMAMPTIISIAEDALVAVPREYRDGSLALGATHLQTIWRTLVPAARSGILAAVMLGVGRAVGETMAVMMVTGNARVIPHSILDPVRTMTATIAAEMGETVHYSTHYHSLFGIGLILFVMTFLLNTVADVVTQRARGR
jgi:phosphate transport system permease protein